jgi:N-ethylmaleimide reductase
VPPDFAADYYAQRADAGLIVSAATNISAQARGYAMTPGIWSPDQVESWQRVARAVHDRHGCIFLQLWHTGRLSHPDLDGGELPVAPSAIRPGGQAFIATGLMNFATPHVLALHEIGTIVEDFYRAAQHAREAGFDGVEIHSANNDLFEQFIRDSSNHRTDRYGGSLQNRLRFPLGVVQAVLSAWGGGERVGIRISPARTMPGDTALDFHTMATYGTYVDELSKAGLVYLHVIEGITQTTRAVPAGIDFSALRKRCDGAYIADNEYTLSLAEQVMANGDADLFSVDRAFIANPDNDEGCRPAGLKPDGFTLVMKKCASWPRSSKPIKTVSRGHGMSSSIKQRVSTSTSTACALISVMVVRWVCRWHGFRVFCAAPANNASQSASARAACIGTCLTKIFRPLVFVRVKRIRRGASHVLPEQVRGCSNRQRPSTIHPQNLPRDKPRIAKQIQHRTGNIIRRTGTF